MDKRSLQIFKSGSKTYFYSSIFFPARVRDDVFSLYGFVRVADNFVDAVPQDAKGFNAFVKRYALALRGKPAGDTVIDNFVELFRRKKFKREWVDAFLKSMAADLKKKNYAAIGETLGYIYGSAEVIGFFMCAVMGLSSKSHKGAAMLGRAMQYINFIRDIDEDNSLGRRYLPLKGYSLPSLRRADAETDRDEFVRFIHDQIEQYLAWQSAAEKSFHYIPKRLRIPIIAASEMYKWTAMKIQKDPFIVYRKKVKPSALRVVSTVIRAIFK